MKPEQLKKLAVKELGYRYSNYLSVEEGGVQVCDPRDMVCREFNPEKDPTQREEVLLWLAGRGIVEIMQCKGGWYVTYDGEDFVAKDYTTALMMAAEKEIGDA